MIGCIGAIRERPVLIYAYVCIVFLVIILQFSFGGAAGAVASGNAKDLQEPLEGVLRMNYKKFDWEDLNVFFPPACYRGESSPGNGTKFKFQHPLCDFDGCYRGADASQEEKDCCTSDFECDTKSRPDTCITGAKCLDTFFRRAAGPVATMCFLPIFLEIMCIIFACIIRRGAAARRRDEVKSDQI